MDLRIAMGVEDALRFSAPEDPWLGLEVYLDPALLEEDALFAKLATGYEGILSVHLPFWNLDLVSPDPEVRNLTLRRLLLGLDRAAELGAERAVFHSGIPHGRTLEEALDRADRLIQALKPVVRRAGTLGVELVLENTHEPEPRALAPILEAYPEVGFCFDAAHARVFSRVPEPGPWLALEPDHLHLNDTDGLYDRHWNLGTGVLGHRTWLGPYLDRTLVLEVRVDPAPSVAFLRSLRESLPDRALTEGA